MSEGASHLINPTYPGGTNSSGEQQPGGVASERDIDGDQRVQDYCKVLFITKIAHNVNPMRGLMRPPPNAD